MLAALRAAPAAVAAATELDVKRSLVTALLLLVAVRAGHAGVLPEDRADVLLHSYDGGGVTIQGPSLLVRKQFAQKFSVSANHYVPSSFGSAPARLPAPAFCRS